MVVKERIAKERQEITEELIKFLGERYEYVIECEYDCSVEEFINTYMRKRYIEHKVVSYFDSSVIGEYQDEQGKYDWVCEI